MVWLRGEVKRLVMLADVAENEPDSLPFHDSVPTWPLAMSVSVRVSVYCPPVVSMAGAPASAMLIVLMLVATIWLLPAAILVPSLVSVTLPVPGESAAMPEGVLFQL